MGCITLDLGGIAVAILAVGLFLQQYNYRYSAIQHGLSNLEYDYLKNYVADSKKRKIGNGNRKRKIDNSGGYGLFSSASNNGLRSLFSVLNFETCPIQHVTYLKLSNGQMTTIFTQNENF